MLNMSLTHWLGILALLVLALGFVTWPAWHRRARVTPALDQRGGNIRAYQTRLAELEAERDTGVLSVDDFNTLHAELQTTLLDDVGTQPSPAAQTVQAAPVRGVGFALAGVLVVVSLALYERWGAHTQLAQAEQLQALRQVAEQGGSPEQVESLLSSLREHLESAPDDVQGWSTLAGTYMNLSRFAQAEQAFRALAAALERVGQDAAPAWGLAAQAALFDSQGRPTPAVLGAIDEALKRNPDELNARGLLGVLAFEAGQYVHAEKHWGRILEIAPDHPQRATLEAGIARAREAQGIPAALAAPAPAVASGAVTVQVDIDPALRDGLDPQTTLFVFARDAEGGPMPLALSRHRVADLPLTITLDDRMAMMPDARLSSASRVLLVARVSFSGQASARTGDLQGFSEPLERETINGPVVVRIDQRVP